MDIFDIICGEAGAPIFREIEWLFYLLLGLYLLFPLFAIQYVKHFAFVDKMIIIWYWMDAGGIMLFFLLKELNII